jgi:hypothetical protein
MKIFCDYHHAGLYHAINMLFRDRLGYEIYRPIGLEWAEQGIWQYSDQLATQRQYLDKVGIEENPAGYYTTSEYSEGIDHRLLTLEQFQKTDIDIILATCSQHELPFAYLQRKYKPGARFIRLAGNSGEPMDWNLTRNLIDTTGLYTAPLQTNYVKIHQEFSTDVFHYEPPTAGKKIKTYVNCFNESPHWDEYRRWRSALPDYQWFEHGHHGTEGFITPVTKLAESMRDATFILHIKSHGEGYGHIIHNAFSVGRPVILYYKYYQGKMAEPLLVDGETCLFLDNRTEKENIDRIRYYTDTSRHLKLCENAHKIFTEKVDFKKDAELVKDFLSRLN